MSYLRDDPVADFEFGESDEDASDDDRELQQFRLENIKDRPPIYEADALHELLEDIGWPEPADWTETQLVTGDEPTIVENVNDDLTRELSFYNQALAAAKAGINKFELAGVNWLRPADYYAENVKSDGHMARVKEQLMYEQRKIDEAEQRRKDRESKRYAKQVQAEKQKERIQQKKQQINEITKLRKQRASSGFEGDLQFDKDMNVKNRLTPDKAGQRIRKDNKPVNKNRQSKNARYGFGGSKKLNKQNTAESAADMNGMRGKKPSGVKGGVKKRPGKNARNAGRSRPGQNRR